MGTSQQVSLVHIVLITSRNNTAVIERIRSSVALFVDPIITVIDNSCERYKRKYNLSGIIKCLPYPVIYIDGDEKKPFFGVNRGLRTCKSTYTIIRSDANILHEMTTSDLIQTGFDEEFLVTPYSLNNELVLDCSPNRPIETVIFKSKFIELQLPFSTQIESSIELLQRAFQKAEPKLSYEIILEIVHPKRSNIGLSV